MARLAGLKGWKVRGRCLVKLYRFGGFSEGLAFVNRVAKVAERMDHHPDVELTYGGVVLRITTHSIGGLTEKDFLLAEAIDKI